MESREASKEERAAVRAKEADAVRSIEGVWARFGQALQRKGITDEQLRKELKTGQSVWNEYETYVGSEKAAALLGSSCTDVKPNDPMPFSYGFKADDYRRLCTVADALHVSLDYLFLRDDVPDRRQMPVSETDTKPGWRTGDPPVEGRYLCRIRFTTDQVRASEARCDWKEGKWYNSFGKKIDGLFEVLSWWPIPPENVLIDEKCDEKG